MTQHALNSLNVISGPAFSKRGTPKNINKMRRRQIWFNAKNGFQQIASAAQWKVLTTPR
ncbi:hypothetical protein RRSWK_01233 [Rhodopirellula sp. SWK7]|nr:hypothetical protein RRSWK_01233 [Rhodopirellula sp. SWK7]